VLKMKPGCERCGASLAKDGDASVCSYECTFCLPCASEMGWTCPNCGGELVRRPRRTTGAGAIALRTPGRIVRLLTRNKAQ
jgi:hypothetical protein